MARKRGGQPGNRNGRGNRGGSGGRRRTAGSPAARVRKVLRQRARTRRALERQMVADRTARNARVSTAKRAAKADPGSVVAANELRTARSVRRRAETRVIAGEILKSSVFGPLVRF